MELLSPGTRDSSPVNRRSFTAGLVSSGIAARSSADCAVQATAGITAEDFRAYIDAFNRGDFAGFGRFYARDVQFEGRGGTFESRDAVLAFYREVKSKVRETLSVRSITLDESGLVADVVTDIEARVDWHEFPTGALRAGDVRRSENFIWYEARDGAFTRIRSAHYQSGSDIDPIDSTEGVASAAAEGSCPRPMSAKTFRDYIDAFNHDDYRAFGEHYDEDVVLVIAGRKALHGRQAIFDFYRAVKRQTRRTIHVDKLIRTPNRLAAELHSEFVATEDSPEFIAGSLKRGQRIFIRTFVLYDLRQGRFARIRSAEYRKIARD
jgi:ketosteroid isomerase-like protein